MSGVRPKLPPERGHETILLVEDEPAILRVAERMLERHGYTVLAVGSPAEAIRLAHDRQGTIDLLMTDVIMPKMNGRALADILLTAHPKLKCLYMSGYSADIIAQHSVLDEGVRFIPKPFTVRGLADKVREALDAEPA